MKIQGQGHNQNRPKSNQVIYRSGPTTVPKMKEIQEVVQKLLPEEESAAGSDAGSAGGGRRMNWYRNIKSHLVYQGDLIRFAPFSDKQTVWITVI